MDFWVKFWTYCFFISLLIFTGLVVTIAVGGFRDIQAMFRKMKPPASPESEDKGPGQD